MKANVLFRRLDEDFKIGMCKDDWSFVQFNEFIDPGFKLRYIGVMLNNTDEIKKVYTATFPDEMILDEILRRSETKILLFSHHAMGYNPGLEGFPFYNIPVKYLQELKKRNISFYVLHLPLDINGIYSTSMTLANALQLEVESEFCEYPGCNVGVVCKSDFKFVKDFVNHVKTTVGHDIKLREYGDDIIKDGKIALAAGGGNLDFVAREVSQLKINTYLTGCTRIVPTFEPVMEFHRISKENRINVIGATHYSTEKYACIAVIEYFKGLGIKAEFIEDVPNMADL